MYKIQANQSGTRSIDINDAHLQTISDFNLFKNLVDSNGIIDENTLDKLRFNVRAILENDNDLNKDLLNLCLDVIYNQNMKAFGLHNLAILYAEWKNKQEKEEEAAPAAE